MLCDYALKLLNLWFWFVAFISFVNMPILERNDPGFHEHYREVTKSAEEVARWLAEQFNRLLAEEKAEWAKVGKGGSVA
jgi:hypothetical protein